MLDRATREIVGWSMRDHMRAQLPLAALIMAAQRQGPGPGLVHHPDRRRQDAAETHGRGLAAMEAQALMSRAAGRRDAPMEGVLHTPKVELAHQRRWTPREVARTDLFASIESRCHRRRIGSALGSKTPEQAKRQMA